MWLSQKPIVLTDKLINQSLLRLQEAKKRAGTFREIAPQPNHICHPQVCAPENEPALISQGCLRAPPLTTDVYLCNHGYIHVCTAERCNNASFGVCNISGACHGQYGGYSSYDSQDYRTRRTTATEFCKTAPTSISLKRQLQHPEDASNNNAVVETVKRSKTSLSSQRRRRRPSQSNHNNSSVASNYYDACRKRIEFLLYDKKRAKINTNITHMMQRKSQNAITQYLHTTQRNAIPPNVIMMAMIMDNFAPEHNVLLSMPTYSDKLVHRYCVIVLHVFQLVMQYVQIKEKINIEDIALGVLYALRTGLKINNLYVLKPDKKLITILPKPNDLSILQINKKTLTHAIAVIKLAYTTAMDNGISRQKLFPDMKTDAEQTVNDEDLVLFALGGKNHKAYNRR